MGEERKNGKGLNPGSNVLTSTTLTFGGRCQYETTIRQKLKLLSKSVEIGYSERSMYLPATIRFTSFARNGEKPGPTTNGWSARKSAALLALQATPWDVPAERLLFARPMTMPLTLKEKQL